MSLVIAISLTPPRPCARDRERRHHPHPPYAILVDAFLDLVTEMRDQALDRPRRGVAERADGVPSTCFVTSSSMSISRLWARPSAMRVSTRHIQPVPSRHGVHWPQLSCL